MIGEKLIENTYMRNVLKMNEEIKLKAKKILSKVMEMQLSEIPNDTNSINIQNWDSLNQVKTSIELEKHLNRELTTEEILSLASLENIVSIFKKNYKS